MKKFVRALIILSVLLSIALGWNIWEQRKEESRAPGSSGIIEGTRVLVSSRIASRIMEMSVEEGQRVQKSEILAKLDCTEADALVASAQARAEATKFQIIAARKQTGSLLVQGKRAKRDTDRAYQLQKEKIVDDVTVELLQSSTDDLSERVSAAQASASSTERQLEAAMAELKRARWQQNECTVSAPLSAIVAVKAREIGEVVMPGATLFELRDDTNLKVTFYIANRDLGRVRANMPVKIVADAFAKEAFEGFVTRVSEEAEFTPKTVQTRSDRDRLVYAVDASVKNRSGMLKAGMPVDATIVETNNP